MAWFSFKAKTHPALEDIPAHLIKTIDKKKEDLAEARISEAAMLEGDVNPRMIKVQTAISKQKYFFLLRAARDQHVKGTWQRAFENTNR